MNFESWIPIFTVVAVFSLAVVVHLATHEVPYMPKWAWGLLIVLTAPLGGAVYLIVVVAGAGGRSDAEGRQS